MGRRAKAAGMALCAALAMGWGPAGADRGADPARAEWEGAGARWAGLPEREAARAVNDWANARVAYARDEEAWGATDRWASPLEALGLGRGDCEDYALLKYAALRRLGVPASRLRLVYAKARVEGVWVAHMVLAYWPEGEERSDPLILDNYAAEALPAPMRPDLAPVFGFGEAGVGLGLGREAKAAKATERISAWRAWLAKARAEGTMPGGSGGA